MEDNLGEKTWLKIYKQKLNGFLKNTVASYFKMEIIVLRSLSLSTKKSRIYSHKDILSEDDLVLNFPSFRS
jgi:hypothetical protein